MRLNIFSHCTIDTIFLNDSKYVVPGGAACYCSLMARILKFDVTLHTKFGSDFPISDYLSEQKIMFKNALSTKLTTHFVLKIFDSERVLILENKCEPINFTETDSDSILISPVFDEIPDFENKIYLEKTDLDLSGISAIKTNKDELKCITGSCEVDGMKILQKNGIDNVILTDKQNISLLSKDKIYSIKLPNIELNDTTGIGDIFCAVFCCTMIKENDILWALSFAGGAAQAALESNQIGLDKIPSKGAIESNASYFYNTIKFKQI